MSGTAFDSALFGPLVSDPATKALFEDKAVLRAFLDVEAALARAEAQTGVIPADAAERIAQVCAATEIDPAVLAEGTARDGVPIPVFVHHLRELVGGDAAEYVHLGATSQDILDTGLILRLDKALKLHEAALWRVCDRLAVLADTYRLAPMAARTRMQQAAPTSFGLKAAGWLSGLLRHLDRVRELKPRCLCVSLSGAAGTLSAFGGKGLAVEAALARQLDLSVASGPWHTQRDTVLDLANWWTLVCGSLGKFGLDLGLLAQNEVAEVSLPGGGSSALPNKVNPVGAETLVALSRHTAGALGTLHQAALQEHERGGAGWTLEWLALPQIVLASGAALTHTERLLNGLAVNTDRMRENLSSGGGLIMAEALSFALARHMDRTDAAHLVKTACQDAAQTGHDFKCCMIRVLDAGHHGDIVRQIDWDTLMDPASTLGPAARLIDRILESHESLREASSHSESQT
ncbi:3-carboxy-cis,cis-muconate cycloisomerase [Roseibium aquae]|uniref:3-carboxy-cis,cis-muconate cycloisomerase n=1 Tax=Roseibium aquae TaxID=1323746 RepID=A0A916X015_9HYPH|nr:3-carboxy-cis,cis-muconate cycloisomerase [Roseibium aquae]GGB42798.1 3-carboxy-cis,cis-muconate cycloisomerase [Roseibium aquae]